MNDRELAKRTLEITEKLRSSKELGVYIDSTGLKAPNVFRGNRTGKIKLIILGQDPTVREMKHRQAIKVVLNLDLKDKSIFKYLHGICQDLGLDIEQNVYATNILKNFFIDRPDQMEKDNTAPGLIKKAFQYWKSLLDDELLEFKDIPVITLGEPVISCIMNKDILNQGYWGYQGHGKYNGKMKHILPSQNSLHRHIFPFPHIHGRNYKLYHESLNRYAIYMRNILNK